MGSTAPLTFGFFFFFFVPQYVVSRLDHGNGRLISPASELTTSPTPTTTLEEKNHTRPRMMKMKNILIYLIKAREWGLEQRWARVGETFFWPAPADFFKIFKKIYREIEGTPYPYSRIF